MSIETPDPIHPLAREMGRAYVTTGSYNSLDPLVAELKAQVVTGIVHDELVFLQRRGIYKWPHVGIDQVEDRQLSTAAREAIEVMAGVSMSIIEVSHVETGEIDVVDIEPAEPEAMSA